MEPLCEFLQSGQCRAQAIMKCYNREAKSQTCRQVSGHQKCDTCNPDNSDLQFAKDAISQRPALRQPVPAALEPSRLSTVDNAPRPRQMYPLTSHAPTVATFQRIVRNHEMPATVQQPIPSQGTDYSNYGDEEPLTAEMLAALDESEVRCCFQSHYCTSLTLSQRMAHPAGVDPSGLRLLAAAPSASAALPQVRDPSFAS